ncbi:hypothetical protein [Streptomyces reniochalinae]|uniref:Uncharacterized protein n=1 Tax=Streptomyces reniochalinae TaxID=2250578 RepID=A0A367EEW5_9ACTN|nr:hypothetical protein [Streptomyces reniochalinae]RCG15760.1 hypothetical protein DQ392_22030 [Streptomyces reniochalinae]
MKQQPEAHPRLAQYMRLDDKDDDKRAVRQAVDKLIEKKTRYRVAAQNNLLPFNKSLSEAAKAEAKNAGPPPPARSWLSRLTPWRTAKPGNAEGRANTDTAARSLSAAAPGARMTAPPNLPQPSGNAPGQVPGPRPENAATRAVSRVVAPPQGGPAGDRPPPVPDKVPEVPRKIPLDAPEVPRKIAPGAPDVPPKIPLDAPEAAPVHARSASPSGREQYSPAGSKSPADPVSRPVSPMDPTSRPVSPMDPTSRPVSPMSRPVSPMNTSAQPASPAFSSDVANRSLEHHLSSNEARGPGSSTSRSEPPPYRAPAVQQTKPAPKRRSM